jgi:hypothetical protein
LGGEIGRLLCLEEEDGWMMMTPTYVFNVTPLLESYSDGIIAGDVEDCSAVLVLTIGSLFLFKVEPNHLLYSMKSIRFQTDVV